MGVKRWSNARESLENSCNLYCLNIKYRARKPPCPSYAPPSPPSTHLAGLLPRRARRLKPPAAAYFSCTSEIITSNIWMLTSYPSEWEQTHNLNEAVKTNEQQRNRQCVIPLLQVTQISIYMNVSGFIRGKMSLCGHSELFRVS